MTMLRYFVIAIALIISFLFAARWLLRRPVRYRRKVNDDLTKFFKALLFRGYDKGILIIEAPNKKRFIQFRKYIIKKGNLGLEFGFPLAPWSEKYYEHLNKLLYDREIEYETRSTGDDIVTSFIIVDLKQDLDRAMELAKMVL